MIRSSSASGLLACALSALACGAGEPPASAPAGEVGDRALDVVVITLDTTRADALGAYGQPLPVSPRIDAMAAEGVLFEQAVTSSPSTFPSHATLFTGKQPYAHGVRANAGYRLSDANTTLAEWLRARGYHTAAEVAAPVMARSKRLDQGFEVYRDPRSAASVLELLDESKDVPVRTNTRSAEDITRRGLEFLRRNAGRPFLLWLHYFDPHQPYEPSQPFKSLLPGDAYYAEIRRVDHHVGLVLDELERLGLRERSVVVLAADHGEGRGEHGEGTHSFFVYDTTMRAPLVFWGAEAIPRGKRVPSLVRLVDVSPTILDLLGLPPLEDAQGVSLRPLFDDPAADLALTGYGESIEPVTIFGSDVLRFVRVGRWKYVHKLEPELFDLSSDAGERRNLAAQQPERLARLRARLEELITAAPPKPADAKMAVDAEERAQLQALGYAAAEPPQQLDDELASLELSGPDPVSRTEDLGAFGQAWGELVHGDAEAAERVFRQLWRRNPDSTYILYGLINTLLRLERDEEVIPLLRRGIELEPGSLSYRRTLGAKLLAQGEIEEAERVLRQALILDPCCVEERLQLSELLRAAARYQEQLGVLEAGDDACLHSVIVRNALAYALATSPEAALRDGARALRLAEAAVAESEGRHPDYIDTLASAWAELGDFERAVAEQKRALAMLEGHAVADDVVESFQRHLAAFEAGEPVREP